MFLVCCYVVSREFWVFPRVMVVKVGWLLGCYEFLLVSCYVVFAEAKVLCLVAKTLFCGSRYGWVLMCCYAVAKAQIYGCYSLPSSC